MTSEIEIVVGGTAADDGAAFLNARRKAEAGVELRERVVAFESWRGLASVMSEPRYRLLRRIHDHPGQTPALVKMALDRPASEFETDLAALADVGLIARAGDRLSTTADSIGTEIRLGAQAG